MNESRGRRQRRQKATEDAPAMHESRGGVSRGRWEPAHPGAGGVPLVSAKPRRARLGFPARLTQFMLRPGTDAASVWNPPSEGGPGHSRTHASALPVLPRSETGSVSSPAPSCAVCFQSEERGAPERRGPRPSRCRRQMKREESLCQGNTLHALLPLVA